MTTTVSRRAKDAPPVSGQPQPFVGFGTLLRFMVRRDRVRGPVWFAAIVGFVVLGSASVINLYNTPAQLQNYADLTHGQAAIKALLGRGYGLDDPTQGAVVMDEMNLLTFIVIALMSIFLVVRHTRAEEDSDRAELIRAAPVGRLTALAAAGTWVTALNLLIAVGITLGMMTIGLPIAGSVAFAAAGLGIGLVFIGVSGVTAQLATSARAATALAGATLGASYLLRAIGDVNDGFLTWLSPLGWAQGIRAYADERWWVLGLLLAAAVVLVAVAVSLSSRRDLGSGILPQRPGPSVAGRLLSSPLGLAVRLQRASVIGWAVGIALYGFFMGLIADQAETLAENAAVADLLTPAGQGSLTDAYLATTVLMTALIVTAFAVSAVLRARAEESAVRADPILATPVGRGRWFGSHLSVAAGGSLLILASSGLAVGLGAAFSLQDMSEVLPVIGASLALLPALLVLVGLAAALVGLLPRWSAVAWAAVAFVILVGLLGDLLQLPDRLRSISPFDHVPALPGAEFEILPLVILTAIAIALAVVGLVAIHRRDIDDRS